MELWSNFQWCCHCIGIVRCPESQWVSSFVSFPGRDQHITLSAHSYGWFLRRQKSWQLSWTDNREQCVLCCDIFSTKSVFNTLQQKIQKIASILRLSEVLFPAGRVHTLTVEHKFTIGRKSWKMWLPFALVLYVDRERDMQLYAYRFLGLQVSIDSLFLGSPLQCSGQYLESGVTPISGTPAAPCWPLSLYLIYKDLTQGLDDSGLSASWNS